MLEITTLKQWFLSCGFLQRSGHLGVPNCLCIVPIVGTILNLPMTKYGKDYFQRSCEVFMPFKKKPVKFHDTSIL